MAIGAGIGALAGLVVYSAKAALSKKTTWNWRDAAAHVAGGVVGGGLFPPLLAGLGAVGVPAAGAYVLSGGIAWGGVWALAQDGASWALGRAKGLGSVSKYVTATAIGVVATATLLPLASRVVGPAGRLAPHAGSVEAFLAPPSRNLAVNVLKSEAEFLAFGALSEGTYAGTVALTNLSLNKVDAVPDTLVPSHAPIDLTIDPAPAPADVSATRADVIATPADVSPTPADVSPTPADVSDLSGNVFQRLGLKLPQTLEPAHEPTAGLVDALRSHAGAGPPPSPRLSTPGSRSPDGR